MDEFHLCCRASTLHERSILDFPDLVAFVLCLLKSHNLFVRFLDAVLEMCNLSWFYHCELCQVSLEQGTRSFLDFLLLSSDVRHRRHIFALRVNRSLSVEQIFLLFSKSSKLFNINHFLRYQIWWEYECWGFTVERKAMWRQTLRDVILRIYSLSKLIGCYLYIGCWGTMTCLYFSSSHIFSWIILYSTRWFCFSILF